MAKQTKKKFEQYGSEFYVLATEIKHILEQNKLDGTSQKQQVEELWISEKLFRDEILKYKYSTQVYKKFIQKIRHIDRNILYAKIYFRESSEVFSERITPFLKSEDPEGLKRFAINFNLIQFIRLAWRGPLGAKAEKLYRRVEEARRVLIENNLPLAINSAKIFYRAVPKSNNTLLDMINVAAQGLASAVDKYIGDKKGEYSRVFCSVILGRVSGNLIKLNSETSLHFYPSDRKILYKANAIKARQGIKDVVELAAAINAAFAADAKEGLVVPKEKVTAAQLQELLNAATMVSVELTAKDAGDGSICNAYDFASSDSPTAEENLITTETNETIGKLISELPPLYRKVLKLRGINF
jgi:DNA-directed RNA polymerase sigma subunit (sigma70/sigma32)